MAAAIKFSISISEENNKKLLEIAKSKDRSRNWIINNAIEKYLKEVK